jgi:exosortase
VFEHLAALGFVLGAVVAVLGLRLVMLFKPSLIAMLFFLPVPGRLRQEIALYLQEWSARIVEVMLDLFGVQVLRAGNSLTVNGVEVAIAEACNGMRMVSALAIVTIAFVFSVPMRREVRLLFLAASPVIALVVNVIRLVPTVLMYGYRSADAADTFHDMSGWGVLVVAIGLLYGMLALLRWLEVPISPYPVRTA